MSSRAECAVHRITPLGPNKKSGRSGPDPANFLASSNSNVLTAFGIRIILESRV